MSATPQFTAVPRIGAGLISAANANRDGTGTVVNIFTAGANGSRVDRIRVKAIVTTTLGMVRAFVHDGANFRLITEIPVAAITVSASVAGFEFLYPFSGGFPLPTGYSLRFSTHNAESFHITCEGGDF